MGGLRKSTKWRRSRSEGTYRPLDRSRREIRLLHVSPRHRFSSIKCHLNVVSLDEKPVYEALSYVWGLRKGRESIRLCGRSAKVTTNLLSALKNICLPDTERVIWIDALCINQDNPDERGQQVSLMGEIYRGAEKVIAWLGHDQDDAQAAFAVIKAMSEFPDHHLDVRLSPHLDAELLEPEPMELLMRLLDCDWWKRVWTFQEMVLAVRLEFRCGHLSLPGEKLAAAHRTFWSHNDCCYSAFVGEYPGHPLADLDKYFSRLSRTYDFASLTEDIVFPAIMAVFRQRECTDPRDKVFGYLGLAIGRFRNFIEPNYQKAPRAVFEETALRIMEKIESLGPLSLLEGPRAMGIACPSWVPTWEEFPHDFIFEAYWLNTFNACRKKPLDQSLISPDKLKVRGVIVGRVDRKGRVPPNHPIKHQTAIYDEWHALAQCSAEIPYRDLKSTREEAFWLTLLNGSFHEDIGPPSAREESVSLPAQDGSGTTPALELSTTIPARDTIDSSHWHTWWSFMHSPSDFLDVDGLKFNTCVTAATVNRAFFTAADADEDGSVGGGWMGIGPPAIQPGYLVVVLNGGLAPYILRPTGAMTTDGDGSRLSEFTILGDCYLHGIMQGEAMDRVDAGIYREQVFVLV